MGAHVGAGDVSDFAVGAATVTVGEAETGLGGGRRQEHEHGDEEEEGNHNHLGAGHFMMCVDKINDEQRARLGDDFCS